jgi:hypothetical protein
MKKNEWEEKKTAENERRGQEEDEGEENREKYDMKRTNVIK